MCGFTEYYTVGDKVRVKKYMFENTGVIKKILSVDKYSVMADVKVKGIRKPVRLDLRKDAEVIRGA